VDGVYEGLVDKSKVREDVSFRQKCKRITPEVVLSAVAGCAKVKKDELQKRHRGSTIRGIACRMLCKHGGLRQREAAEVLGIGTGSAVSFQMRKIENMMKSDESLRNLLNSIEKKLARKSRGTN
jgi:chromosomal replication initiation ATPase DnaA